MGTDKLVVIGGMDENDENPGCEFIRLTRNNRRADSATCETSAPNMDRTRHNCTAACMGEKIYLLGGFEGRASYGADVEVYTEQHGQAWYHGI
mmetsp:Transcript_4922/g.9805  ORF Transcript_4922/g.9805 Transcript_4922/m.9805 type:complete len:93 (+) Transcript_4922:415-693(+)